MAAYAASVTSTMRGAIQLGASPVGVYLGRVNITNYNQTLAAVTAISGKFRHVLGVILGVTDTGYVLYWDGTSIKAWTFEDTGNVPVEVASDVDVGAADFIAFGIV